MLVRATDYRVQGFDCPASQLDVFLNGVEMKRVTACDTEAGWVDCFVRDASRPFAQEAFGELPVTRFFGVVELRKRQRQRQAT